MEGRTCVGEEPHKQRTVDEGVSAKQRHGHFKQAKPTKQRGEHDSLSTTTTQARMNRNASARVNHARKHSVKLANAPRHIVNR